MAIVTGGSTSELRRLVRALASRGIAVAVAYLDDQGAAEAVVEEVVAAGDTAVAVRADLADDLDVERLFQETKALFGGVDVVVHASTLDPSLVNRQAVHQLRRGGAIIDSSPAATIPLELVQRAQEREITISNLAPFTLGDLPGDRDMVADLIALLEQARQPGR